MKDELDNEIFTCMYCKKQFDVTQGTWPQKRPQPDCTGGTERKNL